MKLEVFRRRAFALITGISLLAFSGWASADPPSRVGRLGYMSGLVSFSPAGEQDWDQATINRPLSTGDRLWTDSGARAEIQLDGAMVRMSASASLGILNLDNQTTQLQLTQGLFNVRVRRLDRNHSFEVDTPNLAFTLRQPGSYRIEVDPDSYATTIIMRNGQGEAYGEGAAYLIDAQQSYRFTGTDLRDYQYLDAPRPDEFELWASARDRRDDNSVSARYVSPDVVGYQELDASGTWRVDASYGNVWIPDRVGADWAPYRDGHWAWVEPWGWTWVDDASWGFAVSHYGRWANLRGTWAWVPGPMHTRAYYAPALVAFVGGSNFRLTISSGNVGGVAWFPLAPSEVYRPSYAVSRSYFENINHSNTVVNRTVINNTYNTTNITNVVYANRSVPGAVVAMPTTAFVQSQPVSMTAVRVAHDALASSPVAHIAPAAPTERSVRGIATRVDGRPPARVFERPVVARTEPAPARVGFVAQRQQPTATPGPLDDTAGRRLKPATTVLTPSVKIITPTQVAVPTQLPAPAAADRPGRQSGKTAGRETGVVAPMPSPPVAGPPARPPTTTAQPQRAAPAPTLVPQPDPAPMRQPPEQRSRPEPQGQQAPVPHPPEPKQRAVDSRSVPAPAARPEPTTRQVESRAPLATPPSTPHPSQIPAAPAAQTNVKKPRPADSNPVDQEGHTEENRRQRN